MVYGAPAVLRVCGLSGVLCVASMLGCAHAPCPSDRTCHAAVWTEPAGPDERIVVAPVVDIGVPSQPSGLRATMPVGSRATVLRFDLTGIPPSAQVERAVLSLRPDPSWRPGPTSTRLTVFAVRDPWSAAQVSRGVEPSLGDSVAPTVDLPASVRAPVRVDVTVAVRGWARSERVLEGFGLVADGPAVVFRGAADLEVALR